MIDPSVLLIDWLEGRPVTTKATVKKPKCMCCKKASQADGRRGNCIHCYRVFAHEKGKLKNAKLRREFDDSKVAAGLIKPSKPGRRPEEANHPMRNAI